MVLLSVIILSLLVDTILAAYEPTGIGCTSSNSTVLQFTWSRPSNGNGVVLGYHLNLERTDGIKVSVLPQVDANNYYVETYTYYGLQKYAEYTLTIHSYTANGNDNDVTHSCRTLEDKPDGGPPTVNSTGISYSEIHVTWEELPAYYHCGILLGYKIIYFAYGSDTPKEITVSTATLTYTIGSLDYDTRYVVSVLGYTAVGDGPRTTDPDKTLGPTTKAPEEVTKYYCYEVIPGTLEIAWDGMPCTVYVGIIGGLFTFMMIFMVGCCCKCCGGEKPDGGGMPEGSGSGGALGRLRNTIQVAAALGALKGASAKPSGGGGWNSVRNGTKAAAGLGAFKASNAKRNVVTPYDDEGYYDDDEEEDGFPKNRGDLTTRDIFITSPLPQKDFKPELERPAPPPAVIPVLNKRMQREVSGVDLDMVDDDDPFAQVDDDFNFTHPPPVPRLNMDDDCSVDIPSDSETAHPPPKNPETAHPPPKNMDDNDASFF